MFLFILLTAALFTAVLTYKRIQLQTGFMAVVMSLGIMNFGVLELPQNHSMWNSTLYYVTLLILFTFWFHIFVSICKKIFIQKHAAASVNRFTMGTWVAGNSIMIVLTHYMFGFHHAWISFFAIANVLVWLCFIFLSIYTFGKGITEWKETTLHGNLFLTTVSTQSVAILLLTIFPQVSLALIVMIIIFGLLFYLISFVFITTHFSFSNWNATNCIFHGALSISGLTILFADLLSMQSLVTLWLITLTTFIIIEILEITVFIKLVTRNNPFQVILSSNISHWSRLFTFCMFFTFTHLMKFPSPILQDIGQVLLTILCIVIFSLLILILMSGLYSGLNKKISSH